VKAERAYGGPYQLPAVAVGAEPAILTVRDRLQIEQGPYQLGSNGRRSRRQHVVLGEVIARCIVAEWTENGVGMKPECRPGIWVVRERVPLINEDGTAQIDADGMALWRPAEEDERAAMWLEDITAARVADRAYASALFVDANARAERPELIPFIAANARLAAKAYGMDAEWLREGAALDVKVCPFCTRVIPRAAVKCPRCIEVVDAVAYGQLEAAKKAAVKAATDELSRLAAIERERLRGEQQQPVLG
jgi:hypothetical protein